MRRRGISPIPTLQLGGRPDPARYRDASREEFREFHGQSEVAFAFCHLQVLVKLMPRLKRIKYERLYLPDKEMSGQFPHLAGVLTRPLRWDLVEQQYDEMIKSAVGLKDGTATADAILKRFNSYNVTHPTYKALIKWAKRRRRFLSAIIWFRAKPSTG
jgi:TnpA family transposase